jgi:NTP pyrophosphatase (non-canonical NTP hydrolase)
MDEQGDVAAFVATHDLEAPPAHRVLDLVSEVGELAKAVNLSTEYGATDAVEIPEDEIGDTLFALLALAEAIDLDAGTALETTMAKYDDRLADSEAPGSS